MKRITTLLLLAIVIMPAAWSQTSEINNGNPVCKPAFTGHPCKDRSKEPSLNLGVGNPIHLISGNKYQEETDLPFLPSGLELTRYYNSLSKGNSLLGEGWSHSYDTRLYFAGNKLQIIHADDTRNRIEIEYISRPKTENAPGLTRVKNTDGKHTDFHTSIKGGKYVLEAIEGAGCHGCAIPGTKAEYDSKGRMTSLNGTQIHYDENDNIRQLDINRSPWTGLQLYYDEKDRPVTWFSKITGTEHTRYNDRNQPVEQKFANGDQALFEYDKDGQLEKVTEISKDKDLSSTIKILKSPEKNYIILQHDLETIRYDTRQKNTLILSTERNPIQAAQISFEDKYTFENDGKTRIHHLPEGGHISYFYNQENKPETIIWTEQSGKKHHLILDASIPEKGYVLGNELAFHALKTAKGQTQLSLWNEDKNFWTQTLDFSKDNTLHREFSIVPDEKYETSRSYAYDSSKRLISANTSAHHKEQDLSGQHLYAWHSDGSSAAYLNGKNTVTPEIKRDASGLPIKINKFDLIYDASRKLRFIIKDKKPIATYLYNALDQRILKKTPNSHTYYYYENNKLSGEWTTYKDKHSRRGLNGNIDRRYIYAGNLPVAFIEYEKAMFPYEHAFPHDASAQKALPPEQPHLSKLYFIHTDHIGQPFMVTDQAQTIHWLAHNSPTGKSHILHANIEFNLRLPGQYYDKETGWHYNMNRYYDPEAGHYLEPDPIGPTTNNDPFGYAAQQPRRFTDPLGLLLFAFDGTNNNEYSHSNVSKFQRLYRGEKGGYIEGSGALPYFDDMSTTIDLLSATKTQFIIQEQLKKLFKKIDPHFYGKKEPIPIVRDPSFIPSFTIDLVGFSRGATFALIFANLLAEHTDENGLFTYIYHDAINNNELKTIQACLDLRFIGLFDNVTQLGSKGSSNHEMDYDVPEKWKWVAHAVALHEFRELFPVTILTGSGNNYIEQGFIGAHSDIGGIVWDSDPNDRNNPRPGQYSDLGDIALAWIHWQATQAGVSLDTLDFYKDYAYYPENLQRVDNPFMHGTPDNGGTIPLRDRHVQTAGNNERNLWQKDHPTLGKTIREELEPFIRRIDKHPDTPGRFGPSHRIVGEIDMPSYKQWLKQNLNWDVPF